MVTYVTNLGLICSTLLATGNGPVPDIPPPYSAPTGPWYQAPPPAYTPPTAGYYGWVPPTNVFPEAPPGTSKHRALVYRTETTLIQVAGNNNSP